MQIKRDGLFFKFLSLYDSDTWDLDSCKVIQLILRNLFMTFLLFIILPVVVVLGIGALLYFPFGAAASGFVSAGVVAAMFFYGAPFFVWYKVSSLKHGDSSEEEKPKEPSVASQLYHSWKNKYCLKVEVI